MKAAFEHALLPFYLLAWHENKFGKSNLFLVSMDGYTLENYSQLFY